MQGTWRRQVTTAAAVFCAAVPALAACSTSSGGSSSSATSGSGAGSTTGSTTAALTKVKLQLQWFKQGQFAGYLAAVDKGFYKAQGLDVQILDGGADITPQTVLATGQSDYAIAWVPKALASREAGAAITDVAQVYQRSGSYQVSFKNKNITTAADLKGKKVGNWGYGNEFELFAGMTKAGLDPSKDVTLVQQQFDMKGLLSGDIDAAQAMDYNEYAQLLEATNPKTNKLYTADDFNVINWNTEGTAMLQDAIWASSDKLKSDTKYQDQTTKFIAASLQGWAYCRDNLAECRDITVKSGSTLGASHQMWQINEVNKLIWPSTAGAGMIDQKAWDQTVKIAEGTKNAESKTVLTKAPDAAAYTNDYVTKAQALLKTMKVDISGTSFKPTTVTLTANGD